MPDNIGNTGIEWSNPQVWASVAPLVQQLAKDYNDRADSNLKLKLSLQQAKDKAAQAQALEQLKMQKKEQLETEKQMAAHNMTFGNMLPEDRALIPKYYEGHRINAGRYKGKTGKNPYVETDAEALALQREYNDIELAKKNAETHASSWYGIDRSSITPEQADELATQMALHSTQYKPDGTFEDFKRINRQPFGYARTPELPTYEEASDAPILSSIAANKVRIKNTKENTGGVTTSKTDEVLQEKEKLMPTIKALWDGAEEKVKNKYITKPEFAKTRPVLDAQGNPTYNEQGQMLVEPIVLREQKYKDGSAKTIYDVDKDKVAEFLYTAAPKAETHETDLDREQRNVTNVTVNSGDAGLDGNKKAGQISVAQKPLTEGVGIKRTATLTSIAQANSGIKGGEITLGNNVVNIPDTNPANKGRFLTLKPFITTVDGGTHVLTEKELKEIEGQTGDYADESQIDYVPINISGHPVHKKGKDVLFSIPSSDKEVVGAAAYIQVKYKKDKDSPAQIIHIPVPTKDANVKRLLNRDWMKENGYIYDIETPKKEAPSSIK